MSFAVSISSHVTQPHIKTAICGYKGEALVRQISHPIGGRAQQTMLYKYNWLGVDVFAFSVPSKGDALYGKNVAIFGGDVMVLHRVPIVLYHLTL